MLDLKTSNVKKDSLKYFPFGLVIGLVFLSEIVLVVGDIFKKNSYNTFLLNRQIEVEEALL